MEYESVIGLEVHAELCTKTKIYCGCSTNFHAEPNTNCCPVCTGMPGTLPVLNREVVNFGIRAALATNCTVSHYSMMDRKNYFYPDLPKAYQISQFYMPLCRNGYVEIETADGGRKNIRIKQIHIEEDAGKLIHDEDGMYSKVDYNRCGIPLIEIVSEPDMSSAEEAKEFFDTLKTILMYINVSDCKMQEGSMRCDVNVSVKPKGQKQPGVRTEIKNMNSLSAAVKAIEYEIKRQTQILQGGGKISRETLRWDDAAGVTLSLRSKETNKDYRYFPEPDLVPIIIDDAWIDSIRAGLPQLPKEKMQRYMHEYGLSQYDAKTVTASKTMSDFLDGVIDNAIDAKTAVNWLMGDVQSYMNKNHTEPENIPFTPKDLAKLIRLIDTGEINSAMGKKVLICMFEEKKTPETIVKEKGMIQISNTDELAKMADKVIGENMQSVYDYKNGKDKALGFLMGQVMRLSGGRANPQTVSKIIKGKLDRM